MALPDIPLQDSQTYIGSYNATMRQKSQTSSFALAEQPQSPIRRPKVDSFQTIDAVNRQHAHVKENVSNLHEQMTQSMLEAEAFENNYYNSRHPKTKQVEEFLRRINEQKDQMAKRREVARKKEELRNRRREEIKALEAQAHQLRQLQQKKEQAEIKQRLRKQLAEESKKKQEQYQKFLEQQKKHRVSTQQRRQRYREKFEVPEDISREIQLLHIRLGHQPISKQELDEHQDQYLNEKIKNEERRQFQKRLMWGKEDTPIYYKGKYREKVLQQLVQKKMEQLQDPKELERLKRYKKLQYSMKIREHYVPRVDMNKRLEAQIHKEQTLDRKQLRERSLNPYRVGGSEVRYAGSHSLSVDSSDTDPYLDGIRNLQQLHQKIRVYRQKGLIKKPNKQQSTLTPQPQRNYLEEIKKQHQSEATPRQRLMRKLQKQELKQPKAFENIKLQANLIDQKARRKQKYVRNTQLAPEQSLQLKQSIDDEYIASIMAKISLLNVDKMQT